MRSNHDLDSFIRPSYRRVALGAIGVLGLIGLIAAIGWSALGSSEPAIVAESNDKVPAYSTSTTAKEAPLTSITTISEASADLVAEPAAIAPQSTVTNDQSLPKAIATTSSETSTTSLSAAFVAVPVSSPSADFYPLGNPYSVKPLGNVLLWQSLGTGSRWTIELTHQVNSYTAPTTANTTLSVTFPRGASLLGSCSRETIGSLIRLESYISFDGGVTSAPNPKTDQPRICDQYGTGVIGLWNSRVGSQLMQTFPEAPNENGVPTLLWVRIIGQTVSGSTVASVDSSWVRVDLKSWGR